MSVDEVTETVNHLIDDDNISPCRNTGIMRSNQYVCSEVHRKTPAATVSRPWEERCYEQRDREYAHTHSYTPQRQENSKYRYYTAESGWDMEEEDDMNYEINDRHINNEVGGNNSMFNDYRSCSCHQWDRQDNDRRGRDAERAWQDERSRHSRSQHSHGTARHDREYMDRDRRNIDRRGRHCEIEYSSMDSSSSHDRWCKSGISAKPTSNVKYQLTYPHFSLGQVSGFIGQNLHFHNLTYEQFIAGELTTISNCEDQIEKEGQLELLQKISLWKLRANVAWSQVRSVYAHIIRKLENREINWFADWDRYERHMSHFAYTCKMEFPA